MNWIPIEFPPKKEKYYYCLDEENDVFIAEYSNNGFGWWDNMSEYKEWIEPETPIIYWKNIVIPKPPKEYHKDALLRCNIYLTKQKRKS